MIAIETKFHGPTNHKPARVSATCCNCGRRNYVSFDHALDAKPNEKVAAEQHLDKYHRWQEGKLQVRLADDGHETRAGYVFPLISCEPY